MEETTNVALFEVAVPPVLAPVEEVRRVREWLSFSSAMREVSLFVLYRMWRDMTYMDIESVDMEAYPGQPQYESWSAFLSDLLRTAEISRSTVYSRIKTYALLEWLEYTDHRMVAMMAERPGLYEKVLSAIFMWDQDARMPSGVKTTEFGEMSSPDFKQNVRDFLGGLDAFDSVGDALDHVKHDVLGKPVVRVRFMSPSELNVYFETKSYDGETGEEVVGDSGVVSLYSDEELPVWVLDEIRSRYKIG